MLKTVVSSKSSLFAIFHFLLIHKYFSSLFEIPFFTFSHCPFYRWCSSFDIFTLLPFIAKISSFVHLHRLLSITRIVFLYHPRSIVKISLLSLLDSFVNLSAVIRISWYLLNVSLLSAVPWNSPFPQSC